LSAARQSKRAKISLSSCTSSWAVHWEDSWVNPHMSANTILKINRINIKTTTLPKCYLRVINVKPFYLLTYSVPFRTLSRSPSCYYSFTSLTKCDAESFHIFKVGVKNPKTKQLGYIHRNKRKYISSMTSLIHECFSAARTVTMSFSKLTLTCINRVIVGS